MKKYYINYYKDFANTYDLCWIDNKEDEAAAIAKGYMRITRKDAIAKCTNERHTRKVDPAFSGYGSAEIFNFKIVESGRPYYKEDFCTDDGYIYY